MTARTVRYRTRTEIDRDLIAACRRLGEIAFTAELSLQPPKVAEVASIAEGLRRTLIERASAMEGAA